MEVCSHADNNNDLELRRRHRSYKAVNKQLKLDDKSYQLYNGLLNLRARNLQDRPGFVSGVQQLGPVS